MNFAGYELAKRAIIEAEKKKELFEHNIMHYDTGNAPSYATAPDHGQSHTPLQQKHHQIWNA